MQMRNRLSKPEKASPDLSPHVRRWLGQSVTDEEMADYDAGRLIEPDFDEDFSTLSLEARKWLGV